MVTPNDGGHEGGPSHIHIEKNSKPNWLPWLLLALGVLAALFALSRCGRDENVAIAPAATSTSAAGDVVATTPNAGTSAALAGTSGLGSYLGGREPAPRSFVFEKLNFDTAKSDIRQQDAAEVDQVATALKQYGTARIRIAGYADARGNDAANMTLGKARADSIKAALVAKGIEVGRIETVSGGENDPVDSNSTEGGRFENRRTELVVTAR